MRWWENWVGIVLFAAAALVQTGCATLLSARDLLPPGKSRSVALADAQLPWDPAAPPMMLTVGYDEAFVQGSEAPEHWPSAWLRAADLHLQEDVLADHAYEWRDVPAVEPVDHPDRMICSLFGMRGRHMHNGLDIKAPRRSPVVATAHGKVIKVGWMRGYGRLVVIDHGGGLQTLYAHLQKYLVKEGALVARGQKIGEVGASGRATCAHVHYEVRIHGKPVDPIRYVPHELAQRIE